MKSTQPVLTIAIPTVSAPESLLLSLKVCAAELDRAGIKNEVEIVVSINNLENIEPSRILEIEHFARVILNDGQGDYDSHIDFLVRMSRGRFVKILADDDRLLAGSLRVLLDAAISGGEAEYFYHEFETIDRESPVISAGVVFEPASSASKLVVRSAAWGQVSSLMCLREAWMSSPRPPQTNYIHCYKLQFALLKGGPRKIVYSPQRLVHVALGSPNFSRSADQKVSIGFNGLLVHKLLHRQFGFRVANLIQANRQLKVAASILAHAKATAISFNSAKHGPKVFWFPFLPASLLLLLVLLTPRRILQAIRALYRANR